MLSANQMEIVKEQAFCKKPSSLHNDDGKFICNIYPKSINEIVEMNSSKYYRRIALLLLTETEIYENLKKIGREIPIEEIHPLAYLLQASANDDKFLLELQDTFSTFIKEEVLLLPKINAILIGGESAIQERRLITEDNFKDFQTILRLQNRKEVPEPPPADESPGQRKMRLLREKVAAVKKKQSQKKGEGQTFLEQLEIAATFGIDRNESLYAFYSLLRRHQMKEKWEQDLRMICAGADSKKLNSKYWGESPDD